jgi:hypothetical protein
MNWRKFGEYALTLGIAVVVATCLRAILPLSVLSHYLILVFVVLTLFARGSYLRRE